MHNSARLYKAGSLDPGAGITFKMWYEDGASYDMECNVWCDRRRPDKADALADLQYSLYHGPRRFQSLQLSPSAKDSAAVDIISTTVYRFEHEFANDGGCDDVCTDGM